MRQPININDAKKFIAQVRANPADTLKVLDLCDLAMDMRTEIEDHRTQESRRRSKEREALSESWARANGLLPTPETEQMELGQ